MNKPSYLLLIAVLLLSVVSSCKKEDDDNNNYNNQNNPLSQALGGSPNIPSGAAGALYAVNNHIIAEDDWGI